MEIQGDPRTEQMLANDGSIVVKNGTLDDVPNIYEMFQKHVEYDGMVGMSTMTPELISKTIGSWNDPTKYFEVLIATDTSSCEVVGTCLYEKKFSFYKAKIVWMDQLFVKDSCRGKKVGLRLVHRLAQVAKEEGTSLMWDCLEWNVNSIKFYKSLGAKVMSEIKLIEENIKILGFELTLEAIENLLETKFD